MHANNFLDCTLAQISFNELSVDEREQLLAALSPTFGEQVSFVHGGSIRWPFKAIYTLMYYKNEEIHLQDSRCGRFGLPLNLSKNTSSMPVYCSENECDNMCLSLNLTKELLTSSISGVTTIEKCSTLPLTIFRPLLYQNGCPIGYYRMEPSYPISLLNMPNACYSIQMFSRPVPVQDVEKENVVETYCNGLIMPLRSEYAMFIFMQMSKEIRLADGNHCLFGLTANKIIKYSDWDSIDVHNVDFDNYKWDESMNYDRMLSELSYLAVTPIGEWTWATDTLSCVVCMIQVPYEYPELLLHYNYLEKKLELEVRHQDFLFRENSSDSGFICFALIGQNYMSNLTTFPVVPLNSKYFIEDVGLGQYWCLANTIYHEFRMSSIVDANGMVFAFEITRKCSYSCFYDIDNDLNQFVAHFQQNYKFAKILDSAVVHNETVDSDIEYTFVAHLRLALQDDTIVDIDTNLVSLIHRQVETVFIYEQLSKMIVHDEYDIRSIASTEYCLHESTMSLDAIIWRVVNIGETILTSSLCPPSSQDKSRYCSVDSIHGTFWAEQVNAPNCYSNASELLLELYANFQNSHKNIKDLRAILQDNVQKLLPIDVFLTSRILQKVNNVTSDSLVNVISIFNSLMMIDETFLKIAASFNSTNILLEALDNILLSSHINSLFEHGNVSIHSLLIQTFVLDPVIVGVSGVALYRPRNSTASDYDFTNYFARYIQPNESIDELFSIDNDLVVGSYIPTDMLANLRNVSVAIIVFFNDKLFQSNDRNKTFFETNGKIISMTIFEFNDNSKLPSRIPFFFETNRIDDSTCGYWNFVFDAWSSNGCSLSRVDNFQHLALCECTHLTHFGYLIDSERHEISEINERALTTITIIGSSFSLFGTVGIFITMAVFPNWRKKLSSKILIHFSASIALQMCLMIVANNDSIANHILPCIAMGSALHYSILVMHFWMIIIAYFQIKRYVVIFNFTVSHLLLKSSIFGWVVPLLLVISVLVSDYSLYLPINKDELRFCYPTGWAFNYLVLAPVSLILAVNLIVYLAVFISLKRGFSNTTCMSETAKLQASLSQIRLLAFLFFTLGLTWIFGLLSKVRPNCYLIFSYLFCITATVQGLVVFFYFIVLDSYVRSLWTKYFKNIIGRE